MLSEKLMLEIKQEALKNRAPDDVRTTDVKLDDGDSGSGIRVSGFNSPETEHNDGKTVAHADGQLSKELTQELMDEGAYFHKTGNRGHYGRQLSEFKDKTGRNLSTDLVASGMAFASRSAESAQAELAGIANRALGTGETGNESIDNATTKKSADYFDPFTGAAYDSKSYDRRGTLSKALSRGTDETKAALGGAFNYIGDALGVPEWSEAGREYANVHDTAAKLNGREVETYKDAKKLEDKFTYVVETVGEMAPGLIFDALSTALTGGFGATQAIARRAGIEAIKTGAKRGFIAGPLASGFIQSVGNMENRLEEQGSEVNTGASTASGIAGAVANSIPFMTAFSRMSKAAGLGDDVIEGVAARLKDIGSTALLTGAAEGGTGAIQELIDGIIERKALNKDGSVMEDIKTTAFVDNAIRAVLGGGSMGASGSAGAHLGQKVLSEYGKARENDKREFGDGYEKDSIKTVKDTGDVSSDTLDKIDGIISNLDKMPIDEKAVFNPTSKIPNLPKDRYVAVKGHLYDKGKPVPSSRVNELIEDGTLTDHEVAQFVADDFYGFSNKVIRNKKAEDKGLRDQIVSEVYLRTIDAIRDGTIKTSKEAIEGLHDAAALGRDYDIVKALKKVHPALASIAESETAVFNGRAMWKRVNGEYKDPKVAAKDKREAAFEEAKKKAQEKFTADREKAVKDDGENETPYDENAFKKKAFKNVHSDVRGRLAAIFGAAKGDDQDTQIKRVMRSFKLFNAQLLKQNDKITDKSSDDFKAYIAESQIAFEDITALGKVKTRGELSKIRRANDLPELTSSGSLKVDAYHTQMEIATNALRPYGSTKAKGKLSLNRAKPLTTASKQRAIGKDGKASTTLDKPRQTAEVAESKRRAQAAQDIAIVQSKIDVARKEIVSASTSRYRRMKKGQVAILTRKLANLKDLEAKRQARFERSKVAEPIDKPNKIASEHFPTAPTVTTSRPLADIRSSVLKMRGYVEKLKKAARLGDQDAADTVKAYNQWAKASRSAQLETLPKLFERVEEVYLQVGDLPNSELSAAFAERHKDEGEDSTIGDVHSVTTLANEAATQDFRKAASRTRNILAQIRALGVTSKLDVDGALLAIHKYIKNSLHTDLSKVPMPEGFNKDIQNVTLAKGAFATESKNAATAKNSGQKYERTERFSGADLRKLVKLAEESPEKAFRFLNDKGLIDSDFAIGDNPKLTLKQRVSLMENPDADNRLNDGLNEFVTAKNSRGEEVRFSAKDITRLGKRENKLDPTYDPDSKLEGDREELQKYGSGNPINELVDGFHAGLSALVELGYVINLRELGNFKRDSDVAKLVIGRRLGKPYTLGEAVSYLFGRNRYIDAMYREKHKGDGATQDVLDAERFEEAKDSPSDNLRDPKLENLEGRKSFRGSSDDLLGPDKAQDERISRSKKQTFEYEANERDAKLKAEREAEHASRMDEYAVEAKAAKTKKRAGRALKKVKDRGEEARLANLNTGSTVSILSDTAQSELALRSENFEPKPQAKGRRIQTERKLKTITVRRRKAVKKSILRLVEMVHTRLERIHPVVNELSRKFLEDGRINAERMVSEMADDIGDAVAIQKGYDDLKAGRDSKEAQAYSAFVTKVDGFVSEHDPRHKIKSDPLINLNVAHIDANRSGFVQILREHNVANPEAFIESVFEGSGMPEWGQYAGGTKGMGAKLEVLRPALKSLDEAGMLDNDAPRHLIQRIYAAGRWASWNKYFGGTVEGKYSPNGAFDTLAAEVNPANKTEFIKLMHGVTGKNGISAPPWVRRFNSVAMAFQTATVLWFSAVASVPEVAAIYSRARGMTGALNEDFYKVGFGRRRAEMLKVAKDYNIVVSEVVEHALQQLYSLDGVTTGRIAQKVASTVFKYNGQNWMTETSRVLATSVGRRFLEHHAKNGDERSTRMLAELGIDAETVNKHLEDGDMKSDAGKAYRDALHRFVNQSVTNPSHGQLPLIATDPRFMILTSLKKFFYGFYDNVHKGLYRNYRDSNTKKSEIAPMIITGAMLIPLAGVAEVLREVIKYPLGRPEGRERDLSDWIKATLGATGGLGPLQAAQNAHEMSQYGKSPLVTFAGPTVSYVYDLAHDNVKLSRNIPLASQLPWLAKPIDNTAKSIFE